MLLQVLLFPALEFLLSLPVFRYFLQLFFLLQKCPKKPLEALLVFPFLQELILPVSLEQALDALEADHDYLTEGGVFPEILLQNFIKAKREECRQVAAIPHPAEFERYYNL